MIINEWKNADQMMEVLNHLKSMKYEIVGQGEQAIVFNTNRNVVKIFENDPCYIRFIELILKNKNIHFPKISNIKKMEKGIYKNLWIIKIEKLLSINKVLYEEFYRAFFVILNSNKSKTNKLYYTAKDTFEKYPHLENALELIIQNKSACFLDIIENNVMMKFEGRMPIPVIIDPYFVGRN